MSTDYRITPMTDLPHHLQADQDGSGFEDLIAETANRFARLEINDMDNKIKRTLSHFGRFIRGGPHVSVFVGRRPKKQADVRHAGV